MEINNKRLILKDDLFFPIYDITMHQYLREKNDFPLEISKFCKTKNTVIQAGGNIGFYPKKYSQIFKNVYTFEPDIINFNCLILNTLDCYNIYKYQCGLGYKRTPFFLNKDESNCGGYNIGKNLIYGNIPMLRVDDLNLKNVSLIHFDVEGYEKSCLIGSIKTIKLNKPIIVVEISWDEKNICKFLDKINYVKIGELDVDWIFEYKT
jgi:FkbM family methyltransferase